MKVGRHDVTLRLAAPSDRAWVCSSWLNSLHVAHPKYSRRQCHALVNAVYINPAIQVHVAEVEGQPPLLVGFVAVFDEECLWLYVSHDFHGHGIAKALKELAT